MEIEITEIEYKELYTPKDGSFRNVSFGANAKVSGIRPIGYDIEELKEFVRGYIKKDHNEYTSILDDIHRLKAQKWDLEQSILALRRQYKDESEICRFFEDEIPF